MISHLVGTALDQRQRAPDQSPAYRVYLYSRWQDTDSDIVRSTFKQTPIDITSRVISAALSLDMDTDASSLSLTVSVQDLNLNIFSNCIVQVKEGSKDVDIATWPTTFTGWRLGQTGASESAALGPPTPEAGRGKRGGERTIQLQFHSRERVFTDFEITSDGVWFPNARNQVETAFVYRDAYDNTGDIAREVCTNMDWGLGLTNDECLIGKQPYRIQKQLQFVQISVWEALQNLLQVLNKVPGVNGEGKIVVRDRALDKPTARTYTGQSIISITQPDASFTQLNSVIVRGLAKDLTDVVKKDQRLTSIDGTFGFFDPVVEFSDTWGADKQNSYRVKNGTVLDGDGNSRKSPRIRKFSQEGFIATVNDPEFTKITEFDYVVQIENDTLLVIGLLVAMIAGYVGLTVAVTLLTPESTPPPGQTIVNPGAVAAQIAASLLLIGGIYVLQQIGNFQFEIWGVPFETVYEEIRVDAILGHFGTVSGGAPFREFERKSKEIQNYILSTEDDSVVPATTTEPAVTNPGVRTFARKELAISLAEQAKREIEMTRDILLEPGDIIEHTLDGKRYYITSIGRTLQRSGSSPSIQTCEAFLLPEAP